MKKETAEEVVSHPLWMLPVFMLLVFGGIQAIHTWAHWHMKIDTHGYCYQNKEYLEKIEQDDDDW